MKYLLLFTLIFLFTSCEEEPNNPFDVQQGEPQPTIFEVEKAKPFGTHIEIINVRNHEYIVAWEAGIIHSQSCENDKHIKITE